MILNVPIQNKARAVLDGEQICEIALQVQIFRLCGVVESLQEPPRVVRKKRALLRVQQYATRLTANKLDSLLNTFLTNADERVLIRNEANNNARIPGRKSTMYWPTTSAAVRKHQGPPSLVETGFDHGARQRVARLIAQLIARAGLQNDPPVVSDDVVDVKHRLPRAVAVDKRKRLYVNLE